MLPFVILFSPLLALLGWLSYRDWKATAASDGYEKSPRGFLQAFLDILMALAGGIAFSLLIDAFGVDDRYIATAVLAMIKGCICVVIASGLLLTILRALQGFGPKSVVYCCALLIVGLAFERHHEEQERRAEAPSRPIVLPR